MTVRNPPPRTVNCNCPQCGYSADPTPRRMERKHFDSHSFECDRCGYRTSTHANWFGALAEWERGVAIQKERDALQLAFHDIHVMALDAIGTEAPGLADDVLERVRLVRASIDQPVDASPAPLPPDGKSVD